MEGVSSQQQHSIHPNLNNDSTIHFLYFNARSLYTKLDELCALCEMEKPDIVCIIESWFHKDLLLSEWNIPGYNCVRCDRDGHGGGVALYVSENLEYDVVLNGPSGIEFLLTTVCRMNNPNEKLNIGLWYRPPANSSALDILYSTLESLDVSFLSSFVLLGDFNIDFYNTGHPLFSKLDNISNDFFTIAGC